MTENAAAQNSIDETGDEAELCHRDTVIICAATPPTAPQGPYKTMIANTIANVIGHSSHLQRLDELRTSLKGNKNQPGKMAEYESLEDKFHRQVAVVYKHLCVTNLEQAKRKSAEYLLFGIWHSRK